MMGARRGLALAAALVIAACTSSPGPEAKEHPFSWLEGCWQTGTGTREVWAIGAEDLLFGYGTVPGDSGTAFFEQLRIEKTESGWRYMAYPSGIGPTAFRSTELDDASAMFENPQHDYPQRLSYARAGDQLNVAISLVSGERVQQWSMAQCILSKAPAPASR